MGILSQSHWPCFISNPLKFAYKIKLNPIVLQHLTTSFVSSVLREDNKPLPFTARQSLDKFIFSKQTDRSCWLLLKEWIHRFDMQIYHNMNILTRSKTRGSDRSIRLSCVELFLSPKTTVSCQPKSPSLSFPIFYIFPRQGGCPLYPPLLELHANLQKTRHYKFSLCEGVVILLPKQ